MVDTCGSSGVQQICNVLSYLMGEFSGYVFVQSSCGLCLNVVCFMERWNTYCLKKKVEKTKISRFEVW